jgi:hypothetical protein
MEGLKKEWESTHEKALFCANKGLWRENKHYEFDTPLISRILYFSLGGFYVSF